MTTTSLKQSTLKGDIFGGINAGIVALPAALAFGANAGLQPIHGLYGAIFLGIIAAIFGGTNTLISNPTGPMSYVTSVIVGQQVAKLGITDLPLEERVMAMFPYLMLIFVMAGVFQIIFGLVKLGRYVHYIPEPVISGFMSGIGVIIIIGQIKPFLGVSHDAKGAFNTILAVPEMIGMADPVNVALAATTIAIIYVFPRVTKAVPATLVALLAVTIGAVTFGLGDKYLIGNIPSEIPMPKFDVIEKSIGLLSDSKVVQMMLTSGFYLAAIGMIDSLLTSVVADQMTKTKHKSNRELIGQGIGNTVAALFGGIPGAGTTPATVLNINSGARTRVSGILHGVILLLILLIGGKIAGYIPKPALAGILITIGVSILDKRAIKRYKYMPKMENFIMFMVLTLTVFWSLLYAVAIGLVWAALVFMKEMANVVEGESRDTKVDRLVDQLIENFENSEEFRKHVIVKNLKGPMFFGFASRFQDSLEEIPDGVKAVLFNLSGITYMDQSGLYTFEEGIMRLKDKGINVCISEVRDDSLKMLKDIGVVPNMVDDEHVFSSVEEAVMWLNEPGHMENIFADDGELYIPSAYTPNGDGINDEWELKNIDKFPDCMVKIFTREGKEIFASKGYKVMWEGFDENGKHLPNDTYHYEIDLYGDGKEVRKGNVSIFR